MTVMAFLWGCALRHMAVLTVLLTTACAPSGYMYDAGNFTHPHPTPALCASRGQVLDSATLECVPPLARPPQTMAQAEQSQKSQAVTHERNACVAAANKKFERKAEGQVASYAIWQAEMKQCDDFMVSRLAALQTRGDCSLKLDWMLRYRMMVMSADQKEMAEDRYAEICGPR
jgi:hypothetical protein